MRTRLVWATVVVVAAVSFGAGRAAAQAPVIVPTPKHVSCPDAGWLALDTVKSISIPPDCHDIVGGVDLFLARLRELNLPESLIPPVRFGSGAPLGPGIIHLGVMPNAELAAHLPTLPEPEAEGYRLVVDREAVYLLGSDLPGLHRGLMTLRQIVDAQGRIARTAIADWPDLPLRGAYMAGSAGLEARILQCAALKLNFMLFECGEFFDLGNEANRTRWEHAFALCRSHFVEPVPELQSLGWGQFVLAARPEAAEAVYQDKRRFEIRDGAVHSPSPPAPEPAVVVNGGFEDAATNPPAGWDADRGGDGVSADTEGPLAGRGCLRIGRTESGTTRLWQSVAVRPRQRYALEYAVKTRGIARGTAYGEVYGLKPDGGLGAQLCMGSAARDDQDWRRVAAVFDTGEYERVQIYLRVQDAAGTAWFDETALRGVPGPNPLGNMLISPAAPLVVRDEATGAVCTEGKDYRVVRAPVSYPFESGAPLRVEILPDGALARAAAVLLSYHQAPEGSVTCCPSEPAYQEFMRATIRGVISTLHPKYLHIGHDEPRVLNRDLRCTARGLSNSELFADDIKRMQSFAREADPGVRLMMWSDAINPHHNGPSLDMNNAAALIPKDIIQCPWWYAWPDETNRIENSTRFFLEQGFDVTGSPWFDHRNVRQWAATLHAHRQDNPHVLGMIYTSWSDTTEDPWQALTTAAQYAWNVNGMPLESFLKNKP